jgi:hypothetical protein
MIFFLRKKKPTETHMHHTACTLLIQTNAQSEWKKKPHTYFNAKRKESEQQTQTVFFVYVHLT